MLFRFHGLLIFVVVTTEIQDFLGLGKGKNRITTHLCQFYVKRT